MKKYNSEKEKDKWKRERKGTGLCQLSKIRMRAWVAGDTRVHLTKPRGQVPFSLRHKQ